MRALKRSSDKKKLVVWINLTVAKMKRKIVGGELLKLQIQEKDWSQCMGYPKWQKWS